MVGQGAPTNEGSRPAIEPSRDELYQELRRAPTASEIAGHLGLEREEVVQAQIASGAYSTVSYDAPRRGGSDDDGPSLSDRFGTIDASLATVVDVETVRPLLSALPERPVVNSWSHWGQTRCLGRCAHPVSRQAGEQYLRRLATDSTVKPVPHSGQVRSNSVLVSSISGDTGVHSLAKVSARLWWWRSR